MWEPDKPDIKVGGIYYYYVPGQKTYNAKIDTVRVAEKSPDGKQWLCQEAWLDDDGKLINYLSQSHFTINKRSKLLDIRGRKINVYDKEGMFQLEWLKKNSYGLVRYISRVITLTGSFDTVRAIAELTGYEEV